MMTTMMTMFVDSWFATRWL